MPILLVGTQADLRGGTVGDKFKTKKESVMQIPEDGQFFLIFFRILLQVFPCFLFKELRAGGRNQLGPELGKGLAK